MQDTPESHRKSKNPVAVKWIKRFGIAGFLFFLVKGLIWLAVFIAAAYFGFDFLN